MPDRPTEPRVQRRLAAILAADIVGFSKMMGADEAGTHAALQAVWAERFNPEVAGHRGRIVKMMGDGALVEFASAVDAVECAVAIQAAMAAHNASRLGLAPIDFRIGVNLGDIIIDGDDIFGDGVNVAARLEAQAPQRGVLVSDAVHAQIRGKVNVAFVEAGELALKNIEAPVRVWRWDEAGGQEGDQELAPEQAIRQASQTVSRQSSQNTQLEPTELPSIAVLPFANMSGDPEQEYFADGLVEDIITTLSKLAGLRVIARNSTFVFKGQAVDIRDVAKKLGVKYVLEGSVRRSANRIRITAQLIEAASGSHVWAERYDRSIDDIFAVQDEITLVLATEMQVNLTEGEQARLRYTTTNNVEAWTHWMQGLAHYRKAVTKENSAEAIASWKRALALDPNSATLNAMIGLKHCSDARFGWWDDRETAIGKAKKYADRAIELDPDNPDANITSSLAMLVQARYDEAVKFARRAVALAPGSADAATLASHVLASSGEAEDAVVLGERALTLSPIYPGYYLGLLGNAYRLAGRFDEAIPLFQEVHARNPGFGLSDLVIIYQNIGQLEETEKLAKELLSNRRDFTVNGWAETQFRSDAAGLAADIEALRAAGLPMG